MSTTPTVSTSTPPSAMERLISQNLALATALPAEDQDRLQRDCELAGLNYQFLRDAEEATNAVVQEIDKLLLEREEIDLAVAAHLDTIDQLLSDKEKLERELKTIRDAHTILETCVVCLDSNRTMRFDPCGHTVCCENCARRIHTTLHSCPLCNRHIKGLQPLFF
ncbi:hypothetical protein Unana1_07524 [Umbelopsis nana]